MKSIEYESREEREPTKDNLLQKLGLSLGDLYSRKVERVKITYTLVKGSSKCLWELVDESKGLCHCFK